MDATGVVLRQPLRFPSSSYAAAAPSSSELKTSTASIVFRRRRPAPSGILSSGFCDQGHVKYYNSNFAPSSSTAAMMSAIGGKKEKARDDKASKKMKMKKKQLKLLKGLSRDLSNFSQIGFGLDSDGALLDQVKVNMISEASEILLKQLQKLKAEEKEMKRKLKEEKARLKAARMQNIVVGREMSSSSSSSESSSDSECGEIVDMNNLKQLKRQTNLEQVIEDPTTTIATTLAYQVPIFPLLEPNVLDEKCDAEKTCEENLSSGSLTKIEVCMGGKCKKSGAGALLEEFQKVVGIEGSVSGCKCMGKCRDGPNVKVSADKCVDKAPPNSLCVGVGLEDVGVIVANFLGENNNNQVGFVAAC
ncbi:hypothetical protein PHJA_000117900 [Phtheirospermum japonicum]|uniref:Diacylglycerol O-acyltransferase 3, cytosolic n=1 Tax=Phtheirospermum japonicum TaxID=374723 RepID=A0A830B570_9LAMI|nr:hypothetical protein PHJA_000117900 [Phtheirospermum japonicum]